MDIFPGQDPFGGDGHMIKAWDVQHAARDRSSALPLYQKALTQYRFASSMHSQHGSHFCPYQNALNKAALQQFCALSRIKIVICTAPCCRIVLCSLTTHCFTITDLVWCMTATCERCESLETECLCKQGAWGCLQVHGGTGCMPDAGS